MQRFAVIGLGRFGSRLATNLALAGQEVIGIDAEPRIIEDLRDRVTLAITLDATDEQALRMHGIDKVDVAIVGIGNDFEASAMATVILKQIGVPKVISRAITPTSARILARIGADDVVSPEDESADRWAHRLTTPNFLNQYELAAGHSIVETKCPTTWIGKTLAELSLRAEYNVQVVAIKRATPSPAGAPVRTAMIMPQPDSPLLEGDVLILIGRDPDLAAVPTE